MNKKIFEIQADVCKTLANAKRIEIIDRLSNGEKTVSELVEALEISPANVSQHLSVMRQKGILITRREGVNIFYAISNPKVCQACGLMREVLMEMLSASSEIAREMAGSE